MISKSIWKLQCPVSDKQSNMSYYYYKHFTYISNSFIDTPSTHILPKPMITKISEAPKRSLNLEDYKKKRGLI